MKNNILYFTHILEAIEKIENYILEINESAFYDSTLIQDAVARQLQIIGEAVKRVDEGVKNANPQIAWSRIIGMRNILVHDYFTVDLDILWITLKEDLPLLKTSIQALLKE